MNGAIHPSNNWVLGSNNRQYSYSSMALGPGFLNMNARLMWGTLLEITKKLMENCDWVA